MRGTATALVLTVLVAAFGVELARGAVGNEVALLRMGALPNGGSLGHQYWRLITYSVLHLNYLHLALNLALLWWVGNIVERRIGSAALSAAYLASVVSAGVAIWLARMSSPHPGSSVGASGGIFGLLACALVLLHRPDGKRFGQSVRARLLLWLILCVGLGISFLPGVSFAGHAGGLLAGLLAGSLLPMPPSPDVVNARTDIQSAGRRTVT